MGLGMGLLGGLITEDIRTNKLEIHASGFRNPGVSPLGHRGRSDLAQPCNYGSAVHAVDDF